MRNASRFSQENGKTAATDESLQENLAEEFADVFSYLLDLANIYKIDLGEAYRRKTLKNASRSWK